MKNFEDLEESKMLEKVLLSLPIDERDRKILLSYGKMLYLSGQFEGLAKFDKEEVKDERRI